MIDVVLLEERDAWLEKARAKVPTLHIEPGTDTSDEALRREVADLKAFVERPLSGLSTDTVDEESEDYLLH